jgi:hypothetical protein
MKVRAKEKIEFKNERIYFGERGSDSFWSSLDFISDGLAESAHRARYYPEGLTREDTIRLATAVNEMSYLISLICNRGSAKLGRDKIKSIVNATRKRYSNPTWDRAQE